MPKKIFWGMTGYGPIYPAVYSSHMVAIAYATRELRDQEVVIGGAGCTDRLYTHSAENALVHNMLLDPDAEYLFMTEADMTLPKDVIPSLLALGKDIAAGLYFLRGGAQPCVYKRTVTPSGGNPWAQSPVSIFPTEKPFRANCVGLGCILIRRAVFEKMPYPWFDLKEGPMGYGSDMYFSTKAANMGVETWVNPLVRCGHIDYSEVTYEDYRKRFQDDPKAALHGFIIGESDGV